MRDIPGSFQSNVPSGKSLLYFGLLLASGVFFIFIAFTMFLPVMMLMPQKFAICFTIGCAFIIGSFFALKGPRNQLAHMSSKEVLPLCLSINYLHGLGILYLIKQYFKSQNICMFFVSQFIFLMFVFIIFWCRGYHLLWDLLAVW